MAHRTIRYAVVGLGHIAQVAVLPAFAHARRNSRARRARQRRQDEASRACHGGITSTPRTRTTTTRGVSEQVDAVYIALPNSMHAEYTIRAARAGVHVLCEKPLAVTEEECERMIEACRTHRVKLMVAYRLHFEEINLKAIELVRQGRIGEPRFFNSSFAMSVRVRQHPHEEGAGRRHALRPRRLLHQRRSLPLSCRADRSDGGLGQQRRQEAPRSGRIDGRDPALRPRARRGLRHQLQRRRRRLLSDRRYQGATPRRPGVPSTPKGSPML